MTPREVLHAKSVVSSGAPIVSIRNPTYTLFPAMNQKDGNKDFLKLWQSQVCRTITSHPPLTRPPYNYHTSQPPLTQTMAIAGVCRITTSHPPQTHHKHTLPHPTLPYPSHPYPTPPYPTLPYPTHITESYIEWVAIIVCLRKGYLKHRTETIGQGFEH